jgi:hypothetical protein
VSLALNKKLGLQIVPLPIWKRLKLAPQNRTAVSAPDNASPTPANTAGTSTPGNVSPNSANTTSNQSGQLVQPALGNKGRVELLAAKGVQDPKTGNRDVVNVLFRVYRLAADANTRDNIILDSTTARNLDTGEAYKAYGDKKSTLAIHLFSVKKDIPEDGYVWLKVPEGVNTLDIYIPNTQVFRNVPITN